MQKMSTVCLCACLAPYIWESAFLALLKLTVRALIHTIINTCVFLYMIVDGVENPMLFMEKMHIMAPSPIFNKDGDPPRTLFFDRDGGHARKYTFRARKKTVRRSFTRLRRWWPREGHRMPQTIKKTKFQKNKNKNYILKMF